MGFMHLTFDKMSIQHRVPLAIQYERNFILSNYIQRQCFSLEHSRRATV